MAQQMITLEEAAEKLGITPEEMKKRLKTDPEFKRLSQIRDGSTVRFKLAAIEELGRQLGLASDQDLPLAPVGGPEPGSNDFKVPSAGDKKPAKKDENSPLDFGSSEEDVFSLSEEPKPAGKPASGKSAKEVSDGSSDSDVRLDNSKAKPAKSEEAGVPTEELSLDFGGPGSAAIKGGSSAKLSAPKSSSASNKLSAGDSSKSSAKPADSSEFELSLDADSDDFELQMNPDAGDEVDLGSLPKEKAGASSGKAGKSGINLRDPADSGISLEKEKAKESKDKKAAGDSDSDSDVDFELSLDSSAVASSSKLGAPKSGKLVLDNDSDSEFELTLDDSSGSSLEQAALGAAQAEEAADKGDIFETDFEIPPMPDESASDAVPVESDTDLEHSDFAADDSEAAVEEAEGEGAVEEASESEVVLLGDEDESPATKSKTKVRLKKPPKGGELEEDEDSVATALKGLKHRDEEEEEVATVVVDRPTKPWGVVPLIGLAPSLLIVLLGALMGYEMLNTMWGYQQPRKPAAPITRGLASIFDQELRDQ